MEGVVITIVWMTVCLRIGVVLLTALIKQLCMRERAASLHAQVGTTRILVVVRNSFSGGCVHGLFESSLTRDLIT